MKATVWVRLGIAAFSLMQSCPPASAQDSRLREKRDPFVSLLSRGQSAQSAPTTATKTEDRPLGLSGIKASEVEVVGIARKGKIRMALLKGADGFSHIVRVGARVMDAYLESIEDDRLVFVRKIWGTEGGVTRERLVKQLGSHSVQARRTQ